VIVNHVGLCVVDLERSQRFYVDVLGFTVDRVLPVPDEGSAALLAVEPPVNVTAAYLVRGPFTLELIHFDRPGNPAAVDRPFTQPGLTHLSFSVEDLDASVALVTERGGRVQTLMPGMAAMIRDPDGQLLELLPMSYHRRLQESGDAPQIASPPVA
jgi:catechol 2,3-dioxygenase-like lactoylglutathione lyase family enzyme